MSPRELIITHKARADLASLIEAVSGAREMTITAEEQDVLRRREIAIAESRKKLAN